MFTNIDGRTLNLRLSKRLARRFETPKNSSLKLNLMVLMLLTCCLSTATFAQTPQKALPEPTDPAVRDRERKAMIEFYEALGGHDWIERDFWGSDRPVGEWHGVTTDADGYVVQLTIYDNNLIGRDVARDLSVGAPAYAASLIQQNFRRAAGWTWRMPRAQKPMGERKQDHRTTSRFGRRTSRA